MSIESDLLKLYQEAKRLLERMLPQVGESSKLAGEVREFLNRGSPASGGAVT